MRLDLGSVEFSKNDRKLGIKIPSKLTPELCEFIGIHIGDGSMGIYNKKEFYIQCGGDFVNEKKYYDKYIKPLIKHNFNKDINVSYLPFKVYGFKFKSKAVITFLNRVMGMPLGAKGEIGFPKIIWKTKSKNIIVACLRGIIDTDFGLVFSGRNKSRTYIGLKADFKSKSLVLDLQKCFKYLGIKSHVTFNCKFKTYRLFYGHRIVLYGPEVDKWFALIGSHNIKHISKYMVWKRQGYCPISTTQERLKMLNREDLEKIENMTNFGEVVQKSYYLK